MKTITTSLLVVLTAFVFVTGCVSDSNKVSKPTAQGDGWHKDKDLQRVWLAPGFDFKGFDGIYIAETKFTGPERPNETEMRAWATKYLRDALAGAIPESKVISATYVATNEMPAGAKILHLENNIYDYQKGGGGARYFAGLFGAGQPVIKVRGTMTYDGQPVFQFDSYRSGDSPNARLAGGIISLAYTDRSIQTQDINDLAQDLAGFIRRTAEHVDK